MTIIKGEIKHVRFGLTMADPSEGFCFTFKLKAKSRSLDLISFLMVVLISP